MEARTWTEQFASVLGVPAPSASDEATLLSLASVAANASERVAAPISCWLAARAAYNPDEALRLARELAARLAPPS